MVTQLYLILCPNQGVPASHLHDLSLLKEAVKVQKACSYLSGYRVDNSNNFGGINDHTCVCHSLLMYTGKGKNGQFIMFLSQS